MPYDELIGVGGGGTRIEIVATIYTPAKPKMDAYSSPRPASSQTVTRSFLLPAGERSVSTTYNLGIPDIVTSGGGTAGPVVTSDYTNVLTSLTVKVIKETDQGSVVVFNGPMQVGSSKAYKINQTLYIKGQPLSSASLNLYYREKGSTGSYTQVNVPAVVNNVGTTLPGMYGFDYSSLAKSRYEFYYQALDSQGNVVNEQQGEFNTLKLENSSTLSEGSDTVKVYGNNIIKTGGGNVWGDADTYSVNAYTGGAYVSARAGQLDKHGMFGLSENPTASKEHGTLNYAWYTVNNEDLRIYINGSDQGVFGIYNADDVLAIKYEGTTVSFMKNGVVIKTYTTTASRTFYFDSSLYSQEYALNDIRFGATEASSVPAVLQQNIITKLSGGGAWNSESRSNGGYVGNAFVSASAGQTNTRAMFGLTSTPEANASYTNINYAWYFNSDGKLYIYENGSNVNTAGYGTYNVNDVLAVEYRDNTIYYLKNGEVVTSKAVAAGLKLYYDSSFYDAGFDLHNVKFGPTASTAEYMSAAATAIQYVRQPDDTSANKVNILRRQSYNAFGEVVNETDGNGNVTSFTYNTMGRLIRKTDPQVSITTESGQVQQVAPVTEYTYDAVGRVIGYKDANGNLHMQAWMAGAPEGADDMLSFEKHADGGTKTYMFDIFGNKRQETNEVGQDSWFEYDAMGRLTQTTGYVGNHRYTYDQEGQRISHLRATDNTFTAGDTEKTYFDSLGRITQTKSYMGFATTYTYTFSSSVTGLGEVIGSGWRKTTTNPDGKTLIDDMDMFNRVTWHQDLGGNQFNYHYNPAGWLMSQTGSTGQNIEYSYYQNGYLRAIHDKAIGTYSYYEYDGNGNKTYEAYTTLKDPLDIFAGFSNYYQQTHISYDALNRIDTISDPKAVMHYTYDAVGNRRSVTSTYYQVNGTQQQQQYWYKYDNMNRFLISMGSLVNGNIVVGNEGVDISYNTIGQRIKVINGNADASKITTEVYGYTNEGYLSTVKINGVLRSMRENDAYGRVWRMTEYNASGGITYRVKTDYDADSRTLLQTDYTGATTSYEYYTGSGSSYAAGGAGELARTVNDSNGAAAGGTIVTTHYSYEYWDEAKVTAITANPYNKDIKKNNAVWKPGYSDISYDVNGHMTGAIDRQGNRNIQYVTDAQGKILLREEVTGIIPRPAYRYYSETYNPGSVANKVNRYIYVDGKQVGEINNTGPSRVDYVQSMAARKNQTGNYAGWQPITSADFDQSYEPISPTYPGPVAGNYTVRSGDTLQSIAQTLWGDGSLWYVLADANGLTAADPLVAGMQLTVPNKVTNVHNNAGTFRPYDPGETMGDISPSIPAMPKPPRKKGGCGGIGAIIAAVVTVAVSVALGPAGFGVMNAMSAAAIGSVAGQVTGMALGVQSGFDFKGFATSVITAGILDAAPVQELIGNAANGLKTALGGLKYADVAARAVMGNVIGQGVGNLTGAQKGFSWSSVAISGIGATAAAFATNQLGLTQFDSQGQIKPVSTQFGADLGRAVVETGAFALTQLVVKGGKVNWQQVATDTVTNLIQNRAQSLKEDKYQTALRQQAELEAEPQKMAYQSKDRNYLAESIAAQTGLDKEYLIQTANGPMTSQLLRRSPSGSLDSDLSRLSALSGNVSTAFDDVIMQQLQDGNKTAAFLLTMLKVPAEGSSDMVSGMASLARLATSGEQRAAFLDGIDYITSHPQQFVTDTWNSFAERTWYENLAGTFKLGMGIAVGVGAGKFAKIGPTGSIVGEASELSPFAREISTVYQKYLDDAGDIVSKRLENGYYKNVSSERLRTVMGQDIDRIARDDITAYKQLNDIGDDLLRINKRQYDPNDSSKYRIPDILLPKDKVILDGTIGKKSLGTAQVQDFFKYGGNHVVIQTPKMPAQAITRDMYLNFLKQGK
nr:LysM peptidoglycan-binding domain-containing protein [Methylophilus methylotrophus]